MTFSVVIPSKTPHNLQMCVEAVRRCEPELPPSRIIVVDDCETDAIERYAESAGITRVQGKKPFIFSRNANLGLQKAFGDGADAVVLTNDDALLKVRHGFTHMLAKWQDHPEYGLVSASTNYVGNQNQLRANTSGIRPERRMLCFVCVLVLRHVWETVGPLDERFVGYGFDDDDYSRRVLAAGFRLGICDTCFVDHAQLHSTFRSGEYPLEGFRLNQRLFKEKYESADHHETQRAPAAH